ncbi:hypothetical protein GF1_26180 [Desulfolithobacter dissulfuricans]|uniref:Uncharacterized protein n=1 Tax=Desulfolithobacter dissulfuricans TaxID=2795293 RepID=A0A915XKN6_9BACT|nr:hypothetical protein [Desulfolithobacter dissulfuricans]BCO10242.1 hypothetical protein GF1_26180 [Desulfolithobacter dissulfuricans]
MSHTYDLTEKALEKAAKLICSLKCGLCPIREPDFSGCPFACTEDIRPWQCWVRHLKDRSATPHPPEKTRPGDHSRPAALAR